MSRIADFRKLEFAANPAGSNLVYYDANLAITSGNTTIKVNGFNQLVVPGSGVDDFVDVIVSFVDATGRFFVQLKQNESQIEQLSQTLNMICAGGQNMQLANPRRGQVCAAKYSVDERWYRALILQRISPTNLEVYFADYGNTETMSKMNVVDLRPDCLQLPSQAVECKLIGVDFDSDPALIDKFRTVAEAQEMVVRFVEKKEASILVTLYKVVDNHKDYNINEYLLGKGPAPPLPPTAFQPPVAANAKPSFGQQNDEGRSGRNDDDNRGGFGNRRNDDGQGGYNDRGGFSGQRRGGFGDRPSRGGNEGGFRGGRGGRYNSDRGGGFGGNRGGGFGGDRGGGFGGDRGGGFGDDSGGGFGGGRGGRGRGGRGGDRGGNFGDRGRGGGRFDRDSGGGFGGSRNDSSGFGSGGGGFGGGGGGGFGGSGFGGADQVDEATTVTTALEEANKISDTATVAKDKPTGAVEGKTVTSYPTQPQMSGTLDVFFASVDKLPEFFVMLKSDSDRLSEVSEALDKEFKQLDKLKNPKVGDICAAMFYDAPYRAVVLSVKEDTREVELMYVDYGNKEMKKIDEVKALSSKLAELYPVAITAKLDGVIEDGTAEEKTEAFKELVEECEDLKATVKRFDAQHKCYTMDLSANGEDVAAKIGISKPSGSDVDTAASADLEGKPVEGKAVSDLDDVANALEEVVTRAISLGEANNSVGGTIITSYPTQPQMSGTLDVFYASVDTLPEFFIMLQSDLDRLSAVSDTLVKEFDQLDKLKNPKVGDICAAMFDDVPYRAVVLSVKEDTSEVELKYVDYGNKEMKKMDEVKALPSKLAELYPVAIMATFDGVIEDAAAEENTEAFKELVEECEDLKATVKRFDAQHNCYTVELIANGEDVAAKVGVKPSGGDVDAAVVVEASADLEEKPDEGQAVPDLDDAVTVANTLEEIVTRAASLEEANNVSDAGPVATDEPPTEDAGGTTIPSYPAQPEMSGTLDVFYASVDKLPEFFVMLQSDSDRLSELSDTLANEFGQFDTLKNAKVGDICAAMFDDVPYRAMVLSVNEDKSEVELMYVDYGNKEMKKMDEVKSLPSKLAELYPVAIRATFDGVVEDGKTEENTEAFKELVEECEDLKAVVKRFDAQRKCYTVDLIANGEDVAAKIGIIKPSGGDVDTVAVFGASANLSDIAEEIEEQSRGVPEECKLEVDTSTVTVEVAGPNDDVESKVVTEEETTELKVAMEKEIAESDVVGEDIAEAKVAIEEEIADTPVESVPQQDTDTGAVEGEVVEDEDKDKDKTEE